MSRVSSETQKDDIPAQQRRVPVPWGPVWTVLVTLGSFVGAQVVALLLLELIYSLLHGFKVSLNSAWFGGVASQFYFVVLSDGLVASVLWFCLRRYKVGIAQLGFSRRPALRDALYTLGGYAVYFLMLIIAFQVMSSLTSVNLDQKQELGFDNLLSTVEKLMGFISLVLLPPFVEEALFRGFLFGGLRKRLNFLPATLITSLLFGAPHLLASSHGLLWVAGLDTFLMSLVLCYLREKTGALWASIGLHAVKNSIAFFILLVGM